ncbi:hypothetical protein [uncultured Methanobrevibacter sp.]|uniref:hypothetical protein n=1 Tax=uncultured Methanobrevibacter sp. TaxID=253161 RepID=UPI0025EBF8FF|nr:hypothetical protein [uncultured Methanobrevibacter sp.]
MVYNKCKNDLILKYYLDNKDVFDRIASKIPAGKSPLKKLQSVEAVSSVWKELGEFDLTNNIPNNTPKTDIISENSVIKISVKKAKGAQLMSGGYNETLATIKSAMLTCGYSINDIERHPLILNIKKEKDSWQPIKIINGIRHLKSNIEKELTSEDLNVKKTIINGAENNKLVKKLINELPEDIKIEILKEAITGECKFGTDSKSSANSILIWDENDPEKSLFVTPHEYLKIILNEGYIFNLTYKSANGRSWRAMRIIV